MIKTAGKAAGIDAVVSDNINKDRWQKFVGFGGASGICVLTRSSIGPICSLLRMLATKGIGAESKLREIVVN